MPNIRLKSIRNQGPLQANGNQRSLHRMFPTGHTITHTITHTKCIYLPFPCWCKVTKGTRLTHLMLFILCDLYHVIFSIMFFYVLYALKCFPFLSGLVLFVCLSCDIFSNLCFVSYYHLHCQTNVH